jgi:DNA polymerase III delta subunit
LVVVAGAGRLGRTKDLRASLNDTLANMAPGNGVVLVDQRARRPNLKGARPDGPGELGLLVQDRGGSIVQCISPGPGELASWLLARAKAAGREIAGRLGAEVREPDLDRSGIRMTAAVELEKLMLAIPSGPISLRAVDALVADRGVGSLFAFADAIVSRSGTLVAKHLLRAVSEPGPMVVATLHRKLRDLAQIHGATVVEGASVASAARTIGMHEFPAGKLAEAARKWSSAEIADAINGLVELDAISKSDGERAWGPALTRWSAARIR